MQQKLEISLKVRDFNLFYQEADNLELFLKDHPSFPVILLNRAIFTASYNPALSQVTLKQFKDTYLRQAPPLLKSVYFNMLAVL